MTPSTESRVPVEKPNPETAGRPAGGSDERPGFDLGGAEDNSGVAGTLTPDNPVGNPNLGASRATGGSELTNSKGVKG